MPEPLASLPARLQFASSQAHAAQQCACGPLISGCQSSVMAGQCAPEPHQRASRHGERLPVVHS